MPERRESAFIRATQEAQLPPAPPRAQTEAPPPLQDESSVQPLDRGTEDSVPSSSGSTKKMAFKKVSFYLLPEQEDKLSELEAAFWQRHKRRVNRNDSVRYLIDRCDLESLQGL